MKISHPYPIAHKQEKIIVGQIYSVAHAELVYKTSESDILHVPVIPILHDDKDFNFPWKHYHIDGRFTMPIRARTDFHVFNGRTNHVVVVDDHPARHWLFKKIIYSNRTAIYQHTGLALPTTGEMHPAWYVKWYRTYIGKSCKDRICPHRGAVMQMEADGRLHCPLHDLQACPLTEKILPHPNFAATEEEGQQAYWRAWDVEGKKSFAEHLKKLNKK